jgi:hypothetical protein
LSAWISTTTCAVEREFARKHDIVWGFAIDSYPTLILLDRRGRVVSWDRKDQPPLRGLALGETLLTLMKTEK